jgi:hypothetical protein
MQSSKLWHSLKTSYMNNCSRRGNNIWTIKELWKVLLTQKERDMWLKCSTDIRSCEGLSGRVVTVAKNLVKSY